MTNEEAIHIIDVAFGVPQAVRRFREDRTYHEAEIREAKDMAIKALSCSENPNRCEDAISRQAVIDSLHSKFADGFDSDRWWNSMSVLYAINKVPSISTEKVGEWIPIDPEQHLFQCSVCGSESTVDTVMYKPTWKYCPNCGAKMGVENG